MQAIGRRYRMRVSFAVAVCGCAPGACRPATPVSPTPAPVTAAEAVSLLGEPLTRPAIAPATLHVYEARLAEARRAYDQAPDNADSIIWLGRRTAYLGRYRDAIQIFTAGIAKHPNDARMYRHRGHRYLTVRELDRAIADLTRAAELTRGRPDQVEPDGLPNALNIPTSTLQSNIWYHLGLAHYLKGDFARALGAYREAMRVSTNPDMVVATAHWLYMTLRRLGRTAEAEAVLTEISPDMAVIENAAYHRLLLMYKGVLSPDSVAAPGADALTDATIGYGATGTCTTDAARWRWMCSGECCAGATGHRSVTSPPKPSSRAPENARPYSSPFRASPGSAGDSPPPRRTVRPAL